MISRTNPALDARCTTQGAAGGQEGLHPDRAPVVIIGSLAAIAIPVYLGIQTNAKNATIQSDLTNAKTAVVAYFTANLTATAAPLGAGLASYGYSLNANDALAYLTAGTPTSASSAFSINGTSTDTGTGTYFFTSGGAVAAGACP